MKQKLFFGVMFAAVSLLSACAQKLNVMKYDKIFEVSLGTGAGKLGSNLPILSSFSNRRGLPSAMLLDVPPPVVEGGKVYFADTYNKKVDVFHMDGKLAFSISNAGGQYQFARPYLVYVDKTESIYIAASEKDNEAFEVQHYTNQNMPEKDLRAFQNELAQISPYNYYVYKFSSRGEFVGRFGFTDTDPMPFPMKIEGDYLGNIYIHFNEEGTEDSPARLLLRRYSRSGELNFEFSTRSIKIETNVNNVHYKGSVASVNNLINDEQLLVMVEFQPTTNSKGEAVSIEVDNIFSGLYVYSILENDFTRSIAAFKGITPGVLGTDARGRIFYENYDSPSDTLRIITSSVDEALQNDTNYVPLQSAYYVLNPYFIDSQGILYNTLIDRQSRYFVLRWKKRR